MSPTGLLANPHDTYYKGVRIICLDRYCRLQHNFAVNHHGYNTFCSLLAAKKFIRSAI